MKTFSYVADFETLTIAPTYVWGWGLNKIGSDDVLIGNNIESFINECFEIAKKSKKQNIDIYFHNLKFDGEFILSYLFNNNYVFDEKMNDEKTFSTLITDNGVFFSLSVCYKITGNKKLKKYKITFKDSLKLLPFSVEDIAKGFGLNFSKLEIDYKLFRKRNHILTDDEKQYIKNDILIVSKALEILFNQNLTKMTIASNALSNFKSTLKTKFDKYFPILDYDTDEYLRKSYKGGFTYLNPKYESVIINKGYILDVNSLYPSVMYNELLPTGYPIYFKGKYENDSIYDLYICRIRCQFELKKDMIPTIQLKNNFRFKETEYLTSSDNEFVTLTLTNIDLELFFNHYHVYNLTYIDGYKFIGNDNLFKSYIDYWSDVKIKAKKDNNAALYTLSKLMLNSLYGKFGTNPNQKNKIPYFDDNVVNYNTSELQEKDSIYVALASFVTSYARKKTIETAQLYYDKFIYSDTDSVHLNIDDINLLNKIDIDKFKLGAWDMEKVITKAKYLRAKTYMYTDDKNKTTIKVAGMPASVTKYLTYENFKKGMIFDLDINKNMYDNELFCAIDENDMRLRPLHVEGGVILIPVKFTINS